MSFVKSGGSLNEGGMPVFVPAERDSAPFVSNGPRPHPFRIFATSPVVEKPSTKGML